MTDTGSVRVSLPVFEGPMDLLLYLVKKDEVDIYDIEISRITEQYLNYLAQMQEMDLEVAGEFLLMAAHLIYIKSRTLLPVSEQMPEENVDEDDPRWQLIRQLIEYKKFKDAAETLQEKQEIQMDVFHRQDVPEMEDGEPRGPGRVGMFDLIQAFQKALDRLAAKEGFREIREDAFTVSQKIEYIIETIQPGMSQKFSKLFDMLASRTEIVVTFLALLELIRLKRFTVKQSDAFEDMDIVCVA
ncbi:MAG: segregation and condensation protein A [Verrucomicrobiota bacterium]